MRLLISAMRCQACQQSLRGEHERGSWSEPGKHSYSHYESAIDVCSAAGGGCHPCSVFWSLLSPDDIFRIFSHHQDLRGDLESFNVIKSDPVRVSVSVREAIPGDTAEKTLEIAFPLGYPKATIGTDGFVLSLLAWCQCKVCETQWNTAKE